MKPAVHWCSLCLILTSSIASAQPKSLNLIRNESSASYRLVHPLHNVEAISTDVQYRIVADTSTKEITRVSARVDATSFDSGNSNRDSHAMEVVDAIMYPDVRFSSTSVVQTADSIHVTGRLTFHGITKDVGAAGVVKWTEGKLLVQGGFQISLTAFEVERPSLLMIPVEDTLTFSIVAAFTW